MKTAIVVAVTLVLLMAAALAFGRWSWARSTAALRTRINPAGTHLAMPVYDERDIAGLPPPVQRYFRAVLRNGQPMIASAHLRPYGEMRMKDDDPAWTPFTSDQLAVMVPAGFDWDARIRMAPGVTAFVHDAYVRGDGVLTAKLFGLISVANTKGTQAMAQAELMRYLAEAVWYPTALVPGHGVTWTALDENSATATLVDGNNRASLQFAFDATGMVRSVYSPVRYHGDKDGAPLFAAWTGEFFDPFVQEGIRVPARGEVASTLDGTARTYWRGKVDRIDYEFAPAAQAAPLARAPGPA